LIKQKPGFSRKIFWTLEGQLRTPERRNVGQDGSQNIRQSREDGCLDSRNEDMAKRNYGLPRSNWGLSEE
jgi:hypothetical protein